MHDETHDRGLAFDLKTLATRRRMLGLAGTAVAGAALSGCNPGGFFGGEANAQATAADGSVCTGTPAETAGPFPADGSNSRNGAPVNVLDLSGVVRPDIRPSFDGMTPVAEGVQFDLEIRLVDVGNQCAPLAGRAVYLWHCDREGRYSLYDTDDSNYLRGVGISDDAGLVRFTTVFPGCYAGRWPHFHFEVFASPADAASSADGLLVSQFAVPETSCRQVYADTGYAASLANLSGLSLEGDGIFSGNTPEQLASQTISVSGDPAGTLRGTVTVGLAAA